VIFKKSKTESFKILEREQLTALQSESFLQNTNTSSRSKDSIQSSFDSKRKQTESAMMKQSRIKLNPSHFKLHSKETSNPTVATTVRIKKKVSLTAPTSSLNEKMPEQLHLPENNQESTHSGGALDALSMLADY
jgi:hypothetical protein